MFQLKYYDIITPFPILPPIFSVCPQSKTDSPFLYTHIHIHTLTNTNKYKVLSLFFVIYVYMVTGLTTL